MGKFEFLRSQRGIFLLFSILLFPVFLGCYVSEEEMVKAKAENQELKNEISRLKAKLDEIENGPDRIFGEFKVALESKNFTVAKGKFEELRLKHPLASRTLEAEKVLPEVEKELAEIEKIKKENEEKEQKEREEREKPPLKLEKAWITFNSISNPEARVVVKNVSKKTVDAYTLGIYCFDRFGDPVGKYHSQSNRFGGLSQETVKPGQSNGYDGYWTLHGHENTAKIKVVLEKVHFTDGENWEPKSGQEIFIEGVSNK